MPVLVNTISLILQRQEAEYKMFNKVCKRKEKNWKKNSSSTEEENMLDVDKVGLTDNASNDNEKRQ